MEAAGTGMWIWWTVLGALALIVLYRKFFPKKK